MILESNSLPKTISWETKDHVSKQSFKAFLKFNKYFIMCFFNIDFSLHLVVPLVFRKNMVKTTGKANILLKQWFLISPNLSRIKYTKYHINWNKVFPHPLNKKSTKVTRKNQQWDMIFKYCMLIYFETTFYANLTKYLKLQM